MIAAFAKRSVLLASATILLAGCAVGPDFTRPEPPKDAGYSPKPLTDMVVFSLVKLCGDWQHCRAHGTAAVHSGAAHYAAAQWRHGTDHRDFGAAAL